MRLKVGQHAYHRCAVAVICTCRACFLVYRVSPPLAIRARPVRQEKRPERGRPRTTNVLGESVDLLLFARPALRVTYVFSPFSTSILLACCLELGPPWAARSEEWTSSVQTEYTMRQFGVCSRSFIQQCCCTRTE